MTGIIPFYLRLFTVCYAVERWPESPFSNLGRLLNIYKVLWGISGAEGGYIYRQKAKFCRCPSDGSSESFSTGPRRSISVFNRRAPKTSEITIWVGKTRRNRQPCSICKTPYRFQSIVRLCSSNQELVLAYQPHSFKFPAILPSNYLLVFLISFAVS